MASAVSSPVESRSPGSSSSGPRGVRRLRGLPWEATVAEINVFFSGYAVDEVYICRQDGRATGEAYVIFSDAAQARDAMETRNKKYLGSRYIEIFEATEDDLAAVKRVLADPLLQGFVVNLRGLPYSATKEDVADFLEGVQLAEAEDAIVFDVPNDVGCPSGTCFVELANTAALEAVEAKHGKFICDRYIEVLKGSRTQKLQALKKLLPDTATLKPEDTVTCSECSPGSVNSAVHGCCTNGTSPQPSASCRLTWWNSSCLCSSCRSAGPSPPSLAASRSMRRRAACCVVARSHSLGAPQAIAFMAPRPISSQCHRVLVRLVLQQQQAAAEDILQININKGCFVSGEREARPKLCISGGLCDQAQPSQCQPLLVRLVLQVPAGAQPSKRQKGQHRGCTTPCFDSHGLAVPAHAGQAGAAGRAGSSRGRQC